MKTTNNPTGARNVADDELKRERCGDVYRDFIETFSDDVSMLATVEMGKFNMLTFHIALCSLGITNHGNEHISGELHFIKHTLQGADPCIVFDVGANKGKYASLVKGLHPAAKVYAFEPNPPAYEKLKDLARSKDFFCFKLGLSSEEKVQILYDRLNGEGSEHASLYAEVMSLLHKTEINGKEIALSTLDGMMTKLNIEYINLLKIDTEGHELEVLRGAREALKNKRIRMIQFEFNEMNVISRVFMKDFYDLLPDFNFHRMLPGGLLPLGEYRPLTHEIFALQNIVAIQK